MLDRAEAARCIAKICAYLACGKPAMAREWADTLRGLLADAGI